MTTDYGLGWAIRAALEQQGPASGRSPDPRTVEGLLPHQVPADQQDLLPALNFLLRSRALAQRQDAGRLSALLLAEIQAQFSRSICQREQGVIAELVGQAPPSNLQATNRSTPP